MNILLLHFLILFHFVVIGEMVNEDEARHGPVYVNSLDGSNSSTCGTLTQPCRNLQGAVAKSIYEVILRSTVSMNETVRISHPLTLRSIDTVEYTSVIGKEMNNHTAFKLDDGIDANFTNVKFVNVGVISIGTGSKVFILNCFITGSIRLVFQFRGGHQTLFSSLSVDNTIFTKIDGTISKSPERLRESKLHLTFTNSIFYKVGSIEAEGSALTNSSSFEIIRCSFTDFGYFYIANKETVRIDNSTFRQTQQSPKRRNFTIRIGGTASVGVTQCLFANIHGLASILSINGASRVSLTDTRFILNEADHIIKITTISTTITNSFFAVTNCLFSSNKAAKDILRLPPINVSIISSSFHNNSANNILYSDTTKSLVVNKCYFSDNFGRKGTVYIVVPTQTIRAQESAIITNTVFSNNFAYYYAHSIYIVGPLALINVSIKSRNALGSVYHIDSRNGAIKLGNVTLDIQTHREASLLSGISVMSRIILDKYISLRFLCPNNFNVDIDDEKPFIFRCMSCTGGTYSLLKGFLLLQNRSRSDKRQVKCLECPSGGKCTNGPIKSASNFWGFIDSSKLIFLSCPIGYCCSSDTTPCLTYNTCIQGREGILCGKCENGYRLNFFNSSCVKLNGECSESLFLSYIITYSISTSLLFMYILNISNILKRIWAHLKGKIMCCAGGGKTTEKLPKILIFHLILFYYQLAWMLHVRVDKRGSQPTFLQNVKTKISNFVYFHFVIQVHERVCFSSELTFIQKTGIDLLFRVSTLSNLFLFYVLWISVNFFQRQTGIYQWEILSQLQIYCVQSRFAIWIRTTVWRTFSNWIVHWLTRFPPRNQEEYANRPLNLELVELDQLQIQQREQQQQQHQQQQQLCEDDEEDDQDQHLHIAITDDDPDAVANTEIGRLLSDSGNENDTETKLDFVCRLQLTFIRLLKTIYTPITYTCLQLIYCVSINGTYHLYASGGVVCFTWWQKIILTVVLPGLILFPISFGMALYLIKTRQMRTIQFLIAAAIPYYSVYVFVKTRYTGSILGCSSEKDAMFADQLLESDYEVYRRPNQLLSWPVVQLLRNFLIAATTSLIINPIYRSLAFLPLFTLFLLHDRSAKPFRNKSLNVLQTSSTVCLNIIVMCNIIFSFSLYLPRIERVVGMDVLVTVLSYIEKLMYIILPVMLPVSILWLKSTKGDKEE